MNDDAEHPLAGRTVLVTRPRPQAEAFSSSLRELGARTVECPTIRIREPTDRGPLLAALRAPARYDWLIFTSANGVGKVAAALEELGRPADSFEPLRVAAIGPATAAECRDRLGLSADVVPRSYRAEALAEAVRSAMAPHRRPRMLLPRAARARSELPERLRRWGAVVDEVAAYETVPTDGDGTALRRRLRKGDLDWVTFTASSTVRGFVKLAGARVRPARTAAIGPITASTAAGFGLPVDLVAEEYSIAGLVAALAGMGRGNEAS